MKKEYTIIKYRKGREKDITGTLEYLINYFRYTLECGNSYKKKISLTPKTIKSLVSNLNKSVVETQRGSYDPESYRLF